MRLSVCIATYNGERFISEQVNSILVQLSDEDEIIVSDDGSSDNTLDILRSYKDTRIKIFQNTARHGVVGNFENAIMRAKGKFILLSDQDDIWMANKVKRMLDAFEHYDFVVHDAKLIDGEGKSLGTNYFKLRNTKKGFVNNIVKSGLLGCCMGFERGALKKVLPFPPHILWHDMWIGLVLQMHTKVHILTEELIMYRRHDGNLSTTSEQSKFSLGFMIKYRLVMLYYCLLRFYRDYYSKS